jgi:leucine dehydrogenase
MQPFAEMSEFGHEQVIFCRDPHSGLNAIIAIHDTTLGPALGGVRLYDYDSEAAALRDVLRLSRGMTYKAAVAGLDLGGGKAVIIGDRSVKSEALFRSFGRHVETLGGRYITAVDMNTNVEDMNFIRRETRNVAGAGTHVGGSGDPGPVTAWGVYHGIRASLEVVYGSASVEGKCVAIQGVGSVGYWLAKYLSEKGARLIYNDINGRNLDRVITDFGGEVSERVDFCGLDCDVLAPCAIGGVVNRRTIPLMRAPIIAGAANTILEDEEADSERLLEKGIAYVPDYVINAGGLISVFAEVKGWSRDKALSDSANIFETVKRILNLAQAEGLSTMAAANRVAEERIEAVAQVSRLRLT